MLAVRRVKTIISGHTDDHFLYLFMLAFIIIIIIQITIRALMACQSNCELYENKSGTAYKQKHALNHCIGYY